MNKPTTKQHLRRGFFALAMVGALLLLPPANADRPPHPGPASGDIVGCEQLTNVTHIGNLEIDTLSFCVTSTGTFAGIFEGTETDVVYPDSSETVLDTGVFTGSVSGSQAGTPQFIGRIGGRAPSLTLVIGQGTARPGRLHAVITVGPPSESPPPPDTCGLTFDFSLTAQYNGQFQFAP